MSNNVELTIARLEIRVKNLKKQLTEKQIDLKEALEQIKTLTTENEKLKKRIKSMKHLPRNTIQAGHG